MRYVVLLASLLLWGAGNVSAQDKTYAKSVIDSLASPSLEGRGYVNNGDRKAVAFIEREMRDIGLMPLFAGQSYTQAFTQDVNTFPEQPVLQIGKKKFEPGKEYLIHPYSGVLKGSFPVTAFRVGDLGDLSRIRPGTKTAVLLYAETPEEFKKMSAQVGECLQRVPLVILVNPGKLTWTVSDEIVPGKAVFEVKKDALPPPETIRRVKVNCEPEFHKNHESLNLGGYVEGESKDSFLLVTAHYDHLGRMGKALFPGANDNASGCAMMLNLARFYVGNVRRPHYSIAFVGFAGEEAGLKGSKYFVENPPMGLDKIRFVFNIDLMGGGNIGATVVNGSLFTDEFARMEKINAEHGLLARLNKRGKAANSDHYWFSEKGVPAFFMYAEGGVTAYHDVDDTRENLPLTKYDDLFRLIHRFLDGF